FLAVLVSANCFSQDPNNLPDNKSSFKDRLYTGGNIGLQFGTVTFVDLSPQIGYKITERLSAGIGATYQYYRYKDATYDMSASVYGGRIFSRFMITESFFAHGEYEILNLQRFDTYSYYDNSRINVESLLLGGGYREEIANNVYMNILLLYNFTESPFTPYSNPIIRAGIDIGL
ncbi:MAG: hypothetical protein WCK02_06505, partial [Bacteroidota bacterium]